MNSRQRKVLVEVTRYYEYPHSALDPANPEGDALSKAEEEFLEDVNRAFNLHGSHFEQFFEIHTVIERDFAVDLQKVPGPKGKVLFKIRTLAERLASAEICKKYEVKDLTFEEAPELMDFIPPKQNLDEMQDGHYVLKKAVEMEFIKLAGKYNSLLAKICKKNLE